MLLQRALTSFNFFFPLNILERTGNKTQLKIDKKNIIMQDKSPNPIVSKAVFHFILFKLQFKDFRFKKKFIL